MALSWARQPGVGRPRTEAEVPESEQIGDRNEHDQDPPSIVSGPLKDPHQRHHADDKRCNEEANHHDIEERHHNHIVGNPEGHWRGSSRIDIRFTKYSPGEPYPLTRSTRATTALARNWAMMALRCLRS